MAGTAARPGQLGIGQGLKIILISQSAADYVGGDAAALLGQSLAAYDPADYSPLRRKVEAMLADPEPSGEPSLMTVDLAGKTYRATLALEESEGEPMIRIRLQPTEGEAASLPAVPAIAGGLTAAAVSRFAITENRSEMQVVLRQAMRSAAPDTSGVVMRLDRETGFLVPFLEWGNANESLKAGIPAGDCWALRAGESHLCEGPDDLPCLNGIKLSLPAASVPLLSRAELLGVLILWSESGLSVSLGLAEELAEAIKPHLARIS